MNNNFNLTKKTIYNQNDIMIDNYAYVYDNNNLQIQGTHGNLIEIRMFYDDQHRKLLYIESSNNSIIKTDQFIYNDYGDLKLSKHGNLIIKYIYDVNHRCIKENYSNGSITTHKYNEKGNVIQTNNGESIVNKTYNEKGSILTERCNNNVNKYYYNKENDLIKKIYSNGNMDIIEYDKYRNAIKTESSNGNYSLMEYTFKYLPCNNHNMNIIKNEVKKYLDSNNIPYRIDQFGIYIFNRYNITLTNYDLISIINTCYKKKIYNKNEFIIDIISSLDLSNLDFKYLI